MTSFRRTKIICTIGPASNSLEMMLALIDEGMNVARLNFSHGTHEEHKVVLDKLKEARKIRKTPLALMLDTKGPEIRVGKIGGNGVLPLIPGQRLKLFGESILGSAEGVSITPKEVLKYLKKGQVVIFDNGYILSHVTAVESNFVEVEIENAAPLKSRKGVNLPNADTNFLISPSEQDIADIRFCCENDIDLIAASFIRSAQDVFAIRQILKDCKASHVHIIAKIENHQGVHNFDSILQVADGVMIARGDLGVEVPISQVPRLQKMMIQRCYLAGKPAITATQMLESMIENPRPTRAEVSDVANAIYDSSSAVMLSGETAAGKYPLEAASMMRKVIVETEQHFDYYDFFKRNSNAIFNDAPSSITLAAVKTGYSANASAIFVFTETGRSPRLVSRWRPQMPILALTPNEKCYHQQSLNWGVVPVLQAGLSEYIPSFECLKKVALERQLIHMGDLVVVASGNPFGVPGTLNMMVIENIGAVLLRTHTGYGQRTTGTLLHVIASVDSTAYDARGKIVALHSCGPKDIGLLEQAAGAILQCYVGDESSQHFLAEFAQKRSFCALIGADPSLNLPQNGTRITIDPERAIAYLS